MKKLVLLVDDDKLPMQYYVKALREKGFRVKQCYDPDSAMGFIKKMYPEITAILLDIMMTPGETYKNQDTNEGLITGVFLFKDIRKYCPKSPIIVLTNVKNPRTLAKFRESSSVKIAQKMEWPPFELAELVDSITSSPTE